MGASPDKKLNAKRIVELLGQVLTTDLSVKDIKKLANQQGFDVPDSLLRKNTLRLEELLVHQLVMKACAGNDKSIQEVLDRLIGKPAQYVEQTNLNFSYIDFMAQCEAEDHRLHIQPPQRSPLVIEHEGDLLDELGLL